MSRRLVQGCGAAALCALLLAACGFRPLYQDPEPAAGAVSVGTELAAVEIAPIPDRVGQLVRNDLLYHTRGREDGGGAGYRLDVRLTESISELAVESTGFATRSNLRLSAVYTLIDLGTGRRLVNGRSRAISSYNIVDASFSTLTAQNAARERAAARVAEDIRARLGAYFAGVEEAGSAAGSADPPAAAPPLPDAPMPPAWR
ncbi:MAG: LPS assembly lipoprotein LptE [Rhodospirillales bacterium]|nr:LPS assembly lipoprotein LptE [Rhodospirillales bacterium]